jgi:ABC-type multidrug transport system fused ATPase/permease subunit
MKIEFSQLTYRASSGYNFNESVKKTILNGINGEFKSGELTAIMGPSGSGEFSTLTKFKYFLFIKMKIFNRKNNIIKHSFRLYKWFKRH